MKNEDSKTEQPCTIQNVSKRLFLVTFLGKDERGEIVKGIEVMAESSEQAIDLIKQVSISSEIYSSVGV